MFSALVSRMVKAVLVLLAVIVINFTLINLAPGDPVSVMAGESGAADAAFIEQLRKEFQLDDPMPVRLWNYLSHVVQFDLGQSYRQGRPVLDIIVERLPATLLLTGTAFILSLAAGCALGVAAGLLRGSWADVTITTASLFFYAMPIFWVGIMLLLLFSVFLGWLPAMGMESLGGDKSATQRMLDIAAHLILPAFTLAAFYIGLYARMMRGAIADIAGSDFIRTARAKGVGRFRIVSVHMVRNASLPVLTLAGIQAGQLVGGSVLVETVFAWPGVGRLAFDALMQRDTMLLLGVFVFTAILVIFFNILVDFLYVLLDPRIRARSS